MKALLCKAPVWNVKLANRQRDSHHDSLPNSGKVEQDPAILEDV